MFPTVRQYLNGKAANAQAQFSPLNFNTRDQRSDRPGARRIRELLHDGCVKAQVENAASAAVLSVNITQEQGDKSCEGGDEKTTDGCSGDKVTHIKPIDFQDDAKVAQLSGGCGTLKSKTTEKHSSFE